MYSIADLKKEVLITLDGAPYKVVDSQHVSLGRGGAVMRTKLKNLLNGSVHERTFRPAEKIQPADVSRQPMQYLYRQDGELVFMNQTSYEQEPIAAETLGESARYLSEGTIATLLAFNGRVIGLEMPNTVYLTVTETEPGVRGDTATASLKPCTVETGVVVPVPLFINTGDVIKVDTRTGAYLERKK